ncbi:hypothetical protein D3C84_1054100 [compost metagenome]
MIRQVRVDHSDVRRDDLPQDRVSDKGLLGIAQHIHTLAVVDRISDGRFERWVSIHFQLPRGQQAITQNTPFAIRVFLERLVEYQV